MVRVVVAGQLPREPHNAPLHLFSAAPALVGFGQTAYRRRSAETSLLLGQLFQQLQEEGFVMSFTMEDFKRQYIKEHFAQLTSEEQREALERLSAEDRQEVLQALPPAERLAGLPAEKRVAGLSPEERVAGLSEAQIRRLVEQLAAGRKDPPRKPRRKP